MSSEVERIAYCNKDGSLRIVRLLIDQDKVIEESQQSRSLLGRPALFRKSSSIGRRHYKSVDNWPIQCHLSSLLDAEDVEESRPPIRLQGRYASSVPILLETRKSTGGHLCHFLRATRPPWSLVMPYPRSPQATRQAQRSSYLYPRRYSYHRRFLRDCDIAIVVGSSLLTMRFSLTEEASPGKKKNTTMRRR